MTNFERASGSLMRVFGKKGHWIQCAIGCCEANNAAAQMSAPSRHHKINALPIIIDNESAAILVWRTRRVPRVELLKSLQQPSVIIFVFLRLRKPQVIRRVPYGDVTVAADLAFMSGLEAC